MPNHSSKKKKGQPSSITIDEKHTQMLNEFYDIETNQIPELEQELEQLKTRLANLDEGSNIDKKMELKDAIKEKKSVLKDLKQQKNNYLLNNASYIFNYFEEKKKVSENKLDNKIVLNSFFKIKTKQGESEPVEKYQKSRNFYENYWKNVNKNYIDPQYLCQDYCTRCGTGELIPQEEEGILICNNNKCAVCVQYIVDNEKPLYKEPPNEVTYNAYVRLNHFKEILSQFQAKQTTKIPADVENAIRARIKKERIVDITNEINYQRMREILDTLGYNRYFEHIQFINLMFGIKPPVMSDELQDTLCVLFIEIQEPWIMHCPPDRTNFFNCTYTLYQLCVLLGQTQYLPFIPMMKDRDKQREQDATWKKVCETLDWEYVPTI
jgi:hypothetical protein